MSFDYSLNKTSYTWQSALLWGNCIEHAKAAQKGSLGNRVIHVLIAAAEFLPIIGQIASIFEKIIVTNFSNQKPPFSGYKIALQSGHPLEGIVLTGLSLRPANLFFNKLFKHVEFHTNPPCFNKGNLFRFYMTRTDANMNKSVHEEIRRFCQKQAAQQPNGIVEFSSNDRFRGKVYICMGVHNDVRIPIIDLPEMFGNNIYRISYQEIMNILDSQKIFTSPMLPLPFYRGLKKAMKQDKIILLPGNDRNPVLLKELQGQQQIGIFLANVEKNPLNFGFKSKEAFEQFLEMTLYQIGAMVIKSENYHIFIDGDCKIISRKPGTNDALRLINVCGIRGICSPNTPAQYNKKIMTATFMTSLKAAGEGILVMPAVGMEGWHGDPDLYWTALLDAILVSDLNKFELICVNPRHQPAVSGKYAKNDGKEFEMILDKYKRDYKNNPELLEKLNKICNLYDSQQNIAQRAYNFKIAFPDKTVSLFNASDPDVTLGYHVGEYVNNMPAGTTTEENFTAMGTHGLCFEDITGVHESPDRLIQG